MAGLGSRPTRGAFEKATRRSAVVAANRAPLDFQVKSTPVELGWLIGVIETDGAIYATKRSTARRPNRPAIVVLEVENADEAMMQRVARLLGAPEPRRRTQVANAAGNWTKPTFRVELRSRRAEAVYRHLLPFFMPVTVARIERAFARAGRTLDEPPPRPCLQPDAA